MTRPPRNATGTRALVALVALLSCAWPNVHILRVALAQVSDGQPHWVGTWATALVARPLSPPVMPPGGATPQPPLQISNQTLRQIVRVTIGGRQVRVVFSNLFGTAPLTIKASTVALRQKGPTLVHGSSTPLTFSGKPVGVAAAGAVLFSDPAALVVPDLAELVVDAYLPEDATSSMSPVSHHTGNGALQTNYLSTPGNHVGAEAFPVATTTMTWHFLARVEVAVPGAAGAVVVLGDSIADGVRSTPDANGRWPDHFGRRLLARGVRTGVLNMGIAGNRLLGESNSTSALARFDRDVLAQTGATHVIVAIGVNDIGARQVRATTEQLIAGHRQLITRAHARGLAVVGATIPPFEGTTIAADYWTPEGEATRQSFNQWVRTGGEYDDVIDFDAALRDPSHPTRLLPQYSSTDHLHPNDAGYAAMGAAIDTALFAPDRR